MLSPSALTGSLRVLRRGQRGRSTFGVAVRLEALAISSLILTGFTVVVATEPANLTTAARFGVFEATPAERATANARFGALGRPASTDPTVARSVAKLPKGSRKPAVKTQQRPPVERWLPTGTGMWTYKWENTEGGNARAVVARAKAMGLTHLYVRTGTRKGGFDGGPVLDRLLPATRGTDLKIIAWDFPQLRNPYQDARRLAAAAWYRAPGKNTPRVAAVAPDIETSAEGTRLSSQAVAAYYKELRFRLPKNVAILATIPWPSELRLGKYPFALTARYADALVPMAYWINRNPVTVTQQTMARLKRYGKPVMPAGQAYDPRIDVPSLKVGAPSKAQVDAFFRWSRGLGAPAASLWVWNTASPQHWAALKQAAPLFEPRRPPARPARPHPEPADRDDALPGNPAQADPARKPREPRQAQRAD